MTSWHDKDDFWEKMAPFLFPEERWEVTQEEVDKILGLLDLEAEATILDLGCGPGRHSLEFARRGFQVTGVDRTSAFLQQGREKAEEGGLQVEFIQEDMRDFVKPGTFDAAISMFTSFGYFEDHDENLKVLRNVRTSLKEDGKVLVDVMGKEILARIFQPQGWQERGGRFWLQGRDIIENWSKIENRWIVMDGEGRYEISFKHWLYSGVELSNMLQEAGFMHVTCYGDLSGSEYGPQARRLVCIGQK
jgi:SAM-dependent methyltransferase